MRQLGTPEHVTVIPGNHDAYVEVKWREAWAHWSDYMCGDGAGSGRSESDTFPFLRRRGPIALIGMSTAVATPPTFATGRLGRRQLARSGPCWTGGAGERCRVLLLHHPPVATMTDYRRRLVDADDLARCCGTAGRAGAVRPPAHLPAGRLHPIGAAIPVVGAPSASLHGGDRHHEGGYIIYDLDPGDGGWAIDLELRRFDLATGGFARCSSAGADQQRDRPRIRLEAAG